MAKNPLFYNKWFKTEKHSTNSAFNCIYNKGVEEIINIRGVVMFYFPVSEYDLDSITALWGEDLNVKYLEKYTIKGISEGEQDTMTFNGFAGVTKDDAERVVTISRKSFTDITGRDEPLPGDMFQWTQNNIIYEVIDIDDQEGIILGNESIWKLTAKPRKTEGEVFGNDDCNATRDGVDIDGALAGAEDCGKETPPIGDGNVVEDPDNVHIPGPSTHIMDDEITDDTEKDSGVFIRNSWGNW